MEAHLRKLISDNCLDDFADGIVGAAKPGIRLVKNKTRECLPGMSRLGGVPDVAPGFSWPEYGDHAIALIAQINLAELKESDNDGIFPREGMLYFFCDLWEWPGESDASEQKKFRVVYSPEGNAAPATPPENLPKDQILPAVPVAFRRFLTVPDLRSTVGKTLGLEEDWDSEYGFMQHATHEAGRIGIDKHQLLGWPCINQFEVELESAANWILLAQFDTDGDLDVSWGDCGTLYFWITEEDLRERRFDRSRAFVQCF